jgi:GNAT superfamily N-acetyltransferase
MSSLELLEFSGPELAPWIDALGEVRIRVFREYPYLYEGTLDYERDYLRTYLRSERSRVILVRDGNLVVGATTCVPVADEGAEFQQPFVEQGYDLETICYFGESILLPEYRGRGLGRQFFERREAYAQRLGGCRFTTFCAVDRASDDPRRPHSYRPLDSFWGSLGYVRQPELMARFVWKEIDEDRESPKQLTFWLKDWRADGSQK